MKKVIVLLDVDGVLNATATKIPTQIWPNSQWTRVHVDGFQLTVARPVVDFLNRINRDGLAEIRWHTTWQDRAPHVGEVFGLDDFEVQDCPEWPPTGVKVGKWLADGAPSWWKYHTVVRVLREEKRPVLWIDDDIFTDLKAPYRQELKGVGSIKMVVPETIWGLQPGHLREIDRWLNLKNR